MKQLLSRTALRTALRLWPGASGRMGSLVSHACSAHSTQDKRLTQPESTELIDTLHGLLRVHSNRTVLFLGSLFDPDLTVLHRLLTQNPCVAVRNC